MINNQPRRVLVLVRDSAIAEQLAGVFGSADRVENYQTEHFVDPTCALTRAKEQLFAVVICDLDLQEDNCIEFIGELSSLQPACAYLLLGEPHQPGGFPASSTSACCVFIPRLGSKEEFRNRVAAALAQVDDPFRRYGRFDGLRADDLRAVPLLTELSENQRLDLAAVVDWQTHQPGSCIVSQHDKSDAVFVVVSGFIKITCHDACEYPPPPDGIPERRSKCRRQKLAALRGPGDLIGNVPSLLETGTATAALALTSCQVVAIPCKDFLVCIQNNPGFAHAVTVKIARNRMEATWEMDVHHLPSS